MDFNTLIFPAFFGLCAVLAWLCPNVARPYLLLACSLIFYCWRPADRALVLFLLFAAAITWAAGLLMDNAPRTVKKVLVGISLAACLGVLAVFKYFAFFAELVQGKVPEKLLMPLGLSYFTFQALGYVIDRYRGKYPAEKNPAKYLLFVSFFPCIFTGPIERYDHLMPQLCKKPRFDYDLLAGGAFRMLWGYSKKLILANHLGTYVSAYYAGTVKANGPTTLAVAVLFSLQLYFDFSGACDLAIGGARLLGVRLTENFASPFLATSYADLWRRWHKSLTGWFREYLYFALGGNRKGLPRWAINTVVVFAVSGIWHGSTAGYLWWGLVTGLLVMAEQLPARIRKAKAVPAPAPVPAMAGGPAPDAAPAPAPRRRRTRAEKKPAPAAIAGRFALAWLRRLGVFLVFSLCFVLFSASLYGARDLLAPYAALFTQWTAEGWAVLTKALATLKLDGDLGRVLAGGSLLVLAVESRGDVADWIRRRFFVWRWALYALLAAGLLFFAAWGKSAFIYQMY